MTRFSCCEVCDRAPYCNVGCGSCEEERGNCRACDGTGKITEDDYYSRDCSMCDGSGDYTPEWRMREALPRKGK